MEQNLSQKQIQCISLKMFQSTRILQMNSAELKKYLDTISIDNPVIEIEPVDAGRTDIRKTAVQNTYLLSDREYGYETKETLQEHILSQWVRPLNKKEEKIRSYILNGLDENGYFRERAEISAVMLNVKKDDVVSIKQEIQKMDPCGICAIDLVECLLLQMDSQDEANHTAAEIIRSFLPLLAKGHIDKICEKMQVSEEEIIAAVRKIRCLNPNPGSAFEYNGNNPYIIPDVIVSKNENGFSVELNHADEFTIHISSYYKGLQNHSDAKTNVYLNNKIRQAEWIRDCIDKRNETLTGIVKDIIEKQIDFFTNGESSLRNMKMEDTADAMKMNVSTVSRAINQKYLQCDFGVFPIRYFFTRGSGTPTASRAAVKKQIQIIIESENKVNPLSDQAITDALKQRGIVINRRTIAKYRAEMGIKDAQGRKAPL